MRAPAAVLSWLIVATLAGAAAAGRLPAQQIQATPPAPPASQAQAAPVVHAVLFHSPACQHCRDLLAGPLPALQERYGASLSILGIDASTPGGAQLYGAMVRTFGVGPNRQGVPTMVVGMRVLVGGDEVAGELPGIVDAGLAAGGIDWPPEPELRATLRREGLLADGPTARETYSAGAGAAPDARASDPQAGTGPGAAGDARRSEAAGIGTGAEPEGTGTRLDASGDGRFAELAGDGRSAGPAEDARLAEPVPATSGGSLLPTLSTGPAAAPPTMTDMFRRDPVGNGIAVATLLLLVAALGLASWGLRTGGHNLPEPPRWTLPLLAVAGLGVAAYLAWVETTGATAVCGPVGDCNAVQQSPYARLFGVLPVGVLGMAGYVVMLGLWAAARRAEVAGRGRAAALLLWGAAAAGTAFSLYLTFLEPFVIGATCAWCITSAVLVAAILVAATPAGARALAGCASPAIQPAEP